MKSKVLAVLGICLVVLSAAMNWSIVNTAIPVIQIDLNASLTMMQWLMNSFGLAMVPFLVSFSRLADLYGRKLFYVIAACVFALASLFAALSSSLVSLIIWRCFQGLATAILLPMSQVLVTKQFSKKDSGVAIGIWMLTVGIGCGLGPFIGGLLIQFLSWRWIFYINLPFVLLGFLLCLIFVEESKDSKHTPSLDLLGNCLLVAFLATLIFGIVQGPDWGWTSPVILTLLSVSVICFITFYFVEKKIDYPIVDFSLYKTNRFVITSCVVFYTIFFVWGVFFLLPLYLQNVLDFEPLKAGLTLLIISVPFAIFSPYVGLLQKRFAPKYFLAIGLFLLALSALLASFFPLHVNWLLLVCSFSCFGLGWAVAFGPSITAALESFPHEKIGLAAGSINTSQEFGGSVGLAILGSVFRASDKTYIMDKLKQVDAQFLHEHLVLINSKMSDPRSMNQALKSLHPTKFNEIMQIFYDGFLKGFHNAMLTLSILGFVIFMIVLCFMKKKKGYKS